MTRPGMRWRRDEDGSALIELVWLGVLLLIPLVYVIVSVSEVQRGSFATAGAARAAARAFALAPDDPTGSARVEPAVAQVMADHHVDGAPQVNVSCGEAPDCHAPGAVVTVTVSTSVPLPLLPSFFEEDRSQITVTSSHAVPIGRFQEAS